MERELGDIDYSDIEAKYEVPFDDSLENVIIINGVPVITSAKQQKLFEAIQKRFRTQAEIEVPLECMHIQYGDSGDSKGYILTTQCKKLPSLLTVALARARKRGRQ